MSIKQNTIKGIFWSAIQNWGSQAGSFIIFLILARLLSPEAFGLAALANVFINFMQIFINQGFAQALIQKQELEDKDINTAFWTQVFFSLLLAIIAFSFANVISISFNQSSLTQIIQILSSLFIISAFSQTQTTLLIRKFQFKTLAVRSLLGIFAAGIVGICMALSGYGVWSLVGQQITYESVGMVVLWTANKWRPKFYFSWQCLSELYSFSVNILGYRLVEFFSQRTDNLLIGYFLGEVALGYYAIAHRILEVLIQLLIGTLNQVALPTLSRLQKDYKQFIEAFYQLNKFTSLISFPVFLAIIILSPELLVTLFGEKWSNSIPILQILPFVGIIRTVSFFQRSAFVAMGKPGLQFQLGLINAILNILACLIAVRWGILAVASAYVISNYLVFPLGQWHLSQLISISWSTYLSQFIAPVTCTVIMIIAMLFTQKILTDYHYPFLSLVICSITGTSVFSLTLIAIFPQLFKQICELLTFLKPAFKN
jgi:PST family polysaccharide transporter